MPHKHRRDKSANKSTHELPPTAFAAPLPVISSSKGQNQASKPSSKPSDTPVIARRKAKLKSRKTVSKDGYADDTPRAFQRLMRFAETRKRPSGLDDGFKALSKKRKRPTVGNGAASSTATKSRAEAATGTALKRPTIRPGEHLADFSARVDAALPLANLIPKASGASRRDPAGLEVKKTLKEKKMQRMYAQWRLEDVRLKEKRREAEEDISDGGFDALAGPKNNKKKGKKKRRRGKKGAGEAGDSDSQTDGDDDDNDTEWRRKQSSKPRPLGDVVQAPPIFTVVPKTKFKATAGMVVEDVPKSAGSLRRREELGEVRKGVVEAYRRLMQGKRGGEREVVVNESE